jgi:hypothetical protein
MFYLIQDNTFREENYNTLIKALERLELEYDVIKVAPIFDEPFCLDAETIYTNDRPDIFVFGALQLAKICKDKGWKPGSLMNSNNDFDVYKEYYKDNLLNWDSVVQRFVDPIDFTYGDKFIRPCEDTKVFTGQVFNEYDWEDFVEYSLHNGHKTVLNKDTRIQITTPKTIYKEVRFWVVDKKVITGSTYRSGNTSFTELNINEDAHDFAQSMVEKFQLADAFVIDVCLTLDGWKIVECGCINAAGFYEADMQKVLIALEEFYM